MLAVEPMRFIYRGRIAVFSIKVLRDERVCVIAEQRPDCSEEESFQWMSRVLQAVDSIHQVGIYCLALVPPNHLPKTPLGRLFEAQLASLLDPTIPINRHHSHNFLIFLSFYPVLQVVFIYVKHDDDSLKARYIQQMY